MHVILSRPRSGRVEGRRVVPRDADCLVRDALRAAHHDV